MDKIYLIGKEIIGGGETSKVFFCSFCLSHEGVVASIPNRKCVRESVLWSMVTVYAKI